MIVLRIIPTGNNNGIAATPMLTNAEALRQFPPPLRGLEGEG
jgi:hypothetical protein